MATLWVIKSDGTERAARKVPGVVGRAPAWSKDGTTLAFMSDRSETKLDVAIVRPDGNGLEFLTDGPANERNPTWSPNLPQLAGVSDEDGDQEIYLLDVATKTVSRQLTRNGYLDGNPVWSPDGKEIAFFREMSAGVYHLLKINVETGKEDDLMPNARGQNMDPNWR
jgi:TolB protein